MEQQGAQPWPSQGAARGHQKVAKRWAQVVGQGGLGEQGFWSSVGLRASQGGSGSGCLQNGDALGFTLSS